MDLLDSNPQHRRNKKILFFVDTTNPLWAKLLDRPAGEVKATQVQTLLTRMVGIKKVSAISPALLSNWRHGKPLAPKSADNIFDCAVLAIQASHLDDEEKEELIARVGNFKTIYRDDTVTLYKAGQELKMTLTQCRLILDGIIYSHKPLFYKLYYEPLALNTYFKKYHGLYHLYVKRESKWLKCLLHVRYSIKIQEGVAIRCKMNMPRTDGERNGPKYWIYDGFISAKQNRIFWMFEKRHYDSHDYFNFITGSGEHTEEHGFALSGTYLTTGPGAQQKIFHDHVFMKRVEEMDVHEIETQMISPTGPEIISDQDKCAAISAELADIQATLRHEVF